MKVFKIRNSDGLYSAGNSCPKFTTTGKTWSNIGNLKNHLRQFSDYRSLKVYTNADIICIGEDIKPVNILDFIHDLYKQDLIKNKYEYDRLRIEKQIGEIVKMKESRDATKH